MVSLKRKAKTKLIPDTVDYTKNTGTYFVPDVYQGYGLAGTIVVRRKRLRCGDRLPSCTMGHVVRRPGRRRHEQYAREYW